MRVVALLLITTLVLTACAGPGPGGEEALVTGEAATVVLYVDGMT